MGALRRFSSKPVPLDSPKAVSLKASVKNLVENAKNFSPRQYFDEKYFWEKANVGPVFILLFLTPTIYRSVKDFYWTRQLRKLNTEEVISDRYQWLKMNMLQDEVEAILLQQMPAGGVAPLELGPSQPP